MRWDENGIQMRADSDRAIRRPNYAIAGNDTTKLAPDGAYTTFAVFQDAVICGVYSTSAITIEVLPVRNEHTGPTVTVAVDGGNVFTPLPETRAILIASSTGYNAATVKYMANI